MFKVGFHKKSMIIKAINISSISTENIEMLRRLVIQLIQNPCRKILLDLNGIESIDSQSIEVIGKLIHLTVTQHSSLAFLNVHTDVRKQIASAPDADLFKIISLEESENLKSKIKYTA